MTNWTKESKLFFSLLLFISYFVLFFEGRVTAKAAQMSTQASVLLHPLSANGAYWCFFLETPYLEVSVVWGLHFRQLIVFPLFHLYRFVFHNKNN